MKSEDRILKENVIAIARYHKKYCKRNCGCSLILLGQVLVKAGYKLTKKQMEEFV